MNAALKASAIVVWHHRVLGAFWALCGVFPAVNLLARPFWSEVSFDAALATAAIFVATSLAFIFGSTWARRAMCVLMLIATLVFLDLLLMSGWTGNRQGVWMMLAGLGIVAYTVLFLAVSALYRPKNKDEKNVA